MNVKSRYTIVGIILALVLSVVAIVPVFAASAITSGLVTLTVQTNAGASVPEAKVGNTLYVSNAAAANNKVKVRGIAATNANTATRTITVTNSTSGASSITVVLTFLNNPATTADGYIYEGSFFVGATADTNTVAATDGNSVQVAFVTNVASLTVDAVGPTITMSTPSSALTTRATTIDFTGTVSDAGSGLRADAADTDADGVTVEPITTSSSDASSQDINIQVNPGTAGTVNSATENSDRALWAAATNGYSFSFAKVFSAGAQTWFVKAKDRVGNVDQSDGTAATAGDQDHAFTVDNVAAKMAEAKTGISHNGLTLTAATETVSKSAIRITFTADGLIGGTADNIDATTVAAADFLVSGNTVASTFVAANKVYLTLGTALGAAEKPTVSLVGTVNDSAGNPVTIANKVTVDGIKPTLTVTAAGLSTTGRPLATGNSASTPKGAITITVTADEALNAVPTVKSNSLKWTTSALKVDAATAITMTLTAGTTATYTGTETNATAGLRSIYVTATDKASNSATAGSGTAADAAVTLASAVLFEFDNAIGAQTVSLTPSSTSTSTQSTSPFIRIDFAEGTEYQINSLDKVSQGTPAVSTEVDSHNGVTLTALTLDGVSILASVGTVDADSYIYKASGLAVGSHTLAWAATDAAGNTVTTTTSTDFDFTVTARANYSVPLSPGWNLVSLPGDPSNTSLDSVLPSTHPATSVLTYDAGAANGPWLSASRAADGTWTGTLSTMDSSRAYWVSTTAFTPISTAIPERDPAAVLPTIAIKTGWNLVPIVDLSQAAAGGGPGGNTTTAANYLTSITWAVGYTYSTQGGTWAKITATSGNVLNGAGYWVWATKDGTLVP